MNAPSELSYAAPAPGDIVWCLFPQVESVRPGPKPRPALVLSVDDRLESTPARVRVAYGTSRKLIPQGAGEFAILRTNQAAFDASGLYYPTKFSLRQIVVLPYTNVWFGLPTLGSGLIAPSPKLGILHPTLMADLGRAAQEAGLLTSPRK